MDSILFSVVKRRLRLTCVCALVGAFSSACLERELKPLTPCLVSGVSRTVHVNNIDKIDLLFVVDNSNSMQQEQEALRQQFPRLIRTLTTGKRSQDDPVLFPPVTDLHVGVVSSDMGTPGVGGITGCSAEGGDDGHLLHMSHGSDCAANYPYYLDFNAARGDAPERFAQDVGCIALLGTKGCGLEEQLEAPLKALWPSVYVDAKGNAVADNPIHFLATTQQGTLGNGDIPAAQGGNLGFLRNDPKQGKSLLAIVLVTDEEDCSSKVRDHLIPKAQLDPKSPYYSQDMNLRCHYNPQNLYDVNRYLNGFRGLRPGNEDLVLFAAIVGVPVRLVDEKARAGVKFEDPVARDAYYDGILADVDMQERIDPTQSEGNGNLLPSCVRPAKTMGGELQTAFPPRRIVELVKRFGSNGTLQSICQDDFAPAMDAIIQLIGDKLTPVCLPRPLVRKASGKVSCDVIWELPAAGSAPDGTPTECNQAPGFLAAVMGREAKNTQGGNNCVVTQLPIVNQQVPDAAVGGWYYDDFSTDRAQCKPSEPQRVAFTPPAKPPSGVVVRLECLTETQHLSSQRDDLSAALQPEIGSACGSESGPGASDADQHCVRTRLDGSTDTGLFCHPDLNVCVQACTSSTDCAPSWICDTRPETLAQAHAAYCVNPTCGGG